jgi:hypothetical protein
LKISDHAICAQDLRFIEKTVHGIYHEDDCSGVDPAVIDQFYGTHGRRTVRRAGQTGAGHAANDDINNELSDVTTSSDEETSELAETMGEFVAQIAVAVKKNLRHEPVNVARHSSPFPNKQFYDLFTETLQMVCAEGVVPPNYGICEDEWEDGYPPYEILQVGKGAKKELRISLPDNIWRPRALLWCQALDVLTRFQVLMDT